jgi:membrane-associated phospholipid phosphatase
LTTYATLIAPLSAASQYYAVRTHSLRLEIAFWAACLTLAAAFGALAISASRYYESAIDEKVTFAVQGLYTRAWADPLFETAHRFGEFWPLVGAATVLVLGLIARRCTIEAVVVVAAMVPPMLLAVTNASVGRPDEIYHAMRGTFDGLQYPRIYPSPQGFPSGSVFGEVLVFGLIFLLVSRLTSSRVVIVGVRIGCASVVTIGFFAPMYLGYHWFTDCVGGAILGALVLLIAWRALYALRRERELVRIEDLVGAKRAQPGSAAVGLTRGRS